MRPIRKKIKSKANKSEIKPYQRLLKESILAALGVTSLSSCWSYKPECDNPQALLNQNGDPSGYAQCDNRSNVFRKVGPAQCRGGVASCESDDECATDEACLCLYGEAGKCVSSNCRSGNDCASGRCEYVEYQGLACVANNSECHVDEDCGLTAYCEPRQTNGNHDGVCSLEAFPPNDPFVIEGRPLLDEQQDELIASLIEGRGWIKTNQADIGKFISLPTNMKAKLIEYWKESARLEHSSVASFARVTLELMALGAPANLLLATQEAAADEIKHAQSALEIVSALGGETLEFGRFPTDQVTLRRDRDEIIISMICEACLGETMGVCEAQAMLEQVRYDQGPNILVNHLQMVVNDESRHATLAWQTLKWLLEGDQPSQSELEHRYTLILDSTMVQLSKYFLHNSDQNDSSEGAFGLLSSKSRCQLRFAALVDIILPALVTLMGEERAADLIKYVRLNNNAA